jgi:hypothetical protein
MAKFTQPQNQERDLQAIMEGYESKIGHKYWLAEAFQKDAIQNSWDARYSEKSGKNWYFKLFYFSNPLQSHPILGFEDGGTWGLTGIIPKNEREAIHALTKKEKEKERLAYFLSSNWSNKPRSAIGSRGRGKMIFIGASKNKAIYFESIRLDDQRYVFGRIFLDKDKAIKVEIDSEEIALKKREKIFKNIIPPLSNPGTRILLFNPLKELVEAITTGEIIQLIQHTWWEILHKYQAKIEVEIDGNKYSIPPSLFLPIEKLGVSAIFNSGLITLKENSNLRIKNISLCYLGDKEIPEYYKGLVIQVRGMSVERLRIEKLIFESMGEKIYGAVTFDKELEEEMAQCEGPEHCDIIWTRTPANEVLKILKSTVRRFAEKYKLIDQQKTQISKMQRAVEIATQNDLNQLAKTLHLFGIAGKRRTRTGNERSSIEKLRLSIADFKTPYENGRVDRGQYIEGTYVVPINEYPTSLLVLVKVRIFRHKDSRIVKTLEKELRIPEEKAKIGWSRIKIDDSFEQGGYTFRAEMYSLEDKKIDEGVFCEKGELIYHPVSRTFFVEEDPPEKGFFKIMRYNSPDKRKFIWVEEGDKEYILYYNGLHPIIEPLLNEKVKGWEKLLHDLLFKEGSHFAVKVRLVEDIKLMEEGKEPLVFEKDEIKNKDFQNLFNQIILKRSSYLWDFYKGKE